MERTPLQKLKDRFARNWIKNSNFYVLDEADEKERMRRIQEAWHNRPRIRVQIYRGGYMLNLGGMFIAEPITNETTAQVPQYRYLSLTKLAAENEKVRSLAYYLRTQAKSL